MIRMLKATCPDAASMTNVLGETLIVMYLKSNSQEYDAYHANGQLLSLVHFLELGVPYEILDVICTLYDQTMRTSELEERNIVSGLLSLCMLHHYQRCVHHFDTLLSERNQFESNL
jgi:hypothetical protein